MKTIALTLSLTFGLVWNSYSYFTPENDQVQDSLMQLLQTKISDSTRMMTLMELANHHMFASPLQAQEYFDAASTLIRTGNLSNFLEGYYHWRYGSFLWTQALYDKSLYHLNLARVIFEEGGHYRELGFTLNNIGEVYKKLGDFALSIKFHQQVLRIMEEHGFFYEMSISFINLGEAHLLLKNEDSAAFYLKKGRDLARRNQNNRHMAYSFQYLGDIAFNRGFYLDALSNYQQALVLWKTRLDKRGEANVYNRLAAVALKQSDPARAERYILLAEDICRIERFPDVYLTTLMHKVQMQKQQNRFAEALITMELHSVLKDSVFSIEKRDQLLRIQTQLDLAELEKKNLLLLKEKELAEERLSIQSNVLIFIILTLFVTLGLLYGMIIQRKLATNANKMLERQKIEIEDQQTEILYQSQKLNELNKQLHELNNDLEQKVQSQTEEIRQQKQKIADYAYLNAHKLRAPVASVIGLINLMELSKEGKIDPGMIDHLKVCAHELDQVVNDIRDNLASDVDPDISSISSKYDDQS
jgi:tetratricopeptide (TPR) repeat protein